MNLRFKLNTVIMICCALSFIIIYINFKTKIHANYQQEIESKAEFVLKISDEMDQSPLNIEKSVFFAEDILSDLEFKNIHYLVAFESAINEKFQAKLWQKQIIESFVQDKSKNIIKDIKSDQNGQFQILSKPIKNANNTIIGAKFITIYKRDVMKKLQQDLNQLMIIMISIFISLIIIINIFVHFFIIKPIQTISKQANEISRGNQIVNELEVEGSDEISELSHSFNRIIRSLKAAMKLINS
ncbi:MAG: HAMP domain-containing protein [Marinicellaceae bacterium]